MTTPEPPPPRRLTQSAAGRLITFVLTHPWVVRLKAPLRRAYWAVRGRGTKNPPMPARVESMLFVCLGNICRSPFAAEFAARLLREKGRADIRCVSAGIRPSQAARSPVEAYDVSVTYGVSLHAHRPQPVTAELIEAHGVVVAMEWKHFEHLRDGFPEYRDRIFLLPLADPGARGAYERYNIGDPFGKSIAIYEECYDRIQRSLRRWLEQVA